MTAPLVLWIPARTPSLNAWQRLHWARRRQVARELLALVMAEVCAQRRWATAAPTEPVAVHVTRSCRQPLDPDNLAGGLKPLLDALVRCRLVRDDAPAWCHLTTAQQPDPRPWTEIRLAPTVGA